MTIKTVRFLMVFSLIAAYVILAICDLREGKFRTGFVSALFAAVTWLIFF